jgi:hypothetical protein
LHSVGRCKKRGRNEVSETQENGVRGRRRGKQTVFVFFREVGVTIDFVNQNIKTDFRVVFVSDFGHRNEIFDGFTVRILVLRSTRKEKSK